ncbi:MAG: hypothetical protein L3J56_09610 [Bacteroidales bacterium]|nr:hypothetical protein [Bacteroidales bacterium]
MKKSVLFLFTVVLASFSVSCGGGSGNSLADMKLTELNLTDKGIPITIQAPEGAELNHYGLEIHRFNKKKNEIFHSNIQFPFSEFGLSR